MNSICCLLSPYSGLVAYYHYIIDNLIQLHVVIRIDEISTAKLVPQLLLDVRGECSDRANTNPDHLAPN